MILHISAQNWHVADVNGLQWQTFNFFDSAVRWGVPVFVMISGSLFLDRDISISKMYSKYILRMVISFIVWSLIYSFFIDGTLVNRISAIVQGHYHMWFIPMIIGIYACIPFIKSIIASEKRTKYYLLLSFIFAFMIPEMMTLANDFGTETVIKGANAFNNDVNNLNMNLVLGYASYFVLGYFFNKIDLNRFQRRVIYFLGVLGFVITIILDLLVALKTQTACSHYYGNFNVNVLFEVIAVFTWFKYRKYNHDKRNEFVKKLSQYSYGAYLIHALIIEQLNVRLGLNTLSFNPIISIICILIIVFIVSFVISALLNKIPLVKKYMV